MAYNPDFSTHNVICDAIKEFDEETIIRVYRKIYFAREFDKGVIQAVQDGRITYPVYLSLGQEALAAALSEKIKDYQIFAQHRAHDLFLCVGGKAERLRDELMGRMTGTSGGRAGSNCLQIHENGIDMYGHHGLIGENVPQAVGAALGNGRKTVCLFGDGAGEEDYIYPSLGFAKKQRLPVCFVCVDNGLSILTPKDARRDWEIFDVAKAMGMQSIDVADCPFTLMLELQNMDLNKPAFINCRVCRERWHVGVGTDGKRVWERNTIVRQDIVEIGLEEKVIMAENEIDQYMKGLWES